MNRLGLVLLVAAVVGSATWAYHINYETRTALDRIDTLRHQIAQEREAVEVLRVEWAYLNAPERLARLVANHNDTLRLEPMAGHVFEEVASIPFPPDLVPDDAVPQEIPPEATVARPRQTLVAAAVPRPLPRPGLWRRQ